MLKLVLFLQVIILIVLAFFGIFVYEQAQIASDSINDALTVIDEVSAILPKLDIALDSINQLQSVFESLESLSNVLSLLTDPFSSGD